MPVVLASEVWKYRKHSMPQDGWVAWYTLADLRVLTIYLLSLVIAASLAAEVVEVELTLPLPARLDLRDRNTVAVVPFMTVSFDGESSSEIGDLDVEGEFDSYLNRVLRRNTHLKVLESGPLEFPTRDLSKLARDSDFWRFVGESTQADLVLAGALDFDIETRSGYRTEPFTATSTTTFYRQVLVERSGYEFDILMLVLDGRSGELMFADNFKDFREFERARVDPLVGMYENLDALEDRIVGIFTQRWLRTTRSMFGH